LREMNKLLVIAAIFFLSQNGFGQNSPGVSSLPSGTDIDPADSLHLIVDLNAIDASLEPAQALLFAANNGADMYIWTWEPAEHPAGHPLANGTGGQAWKNSNEALKMTKVDSLGDLVYVYSMVPTTFYEVDAKTVFDNDIRFLVKPKDGGGFGDPDIKSADMILFIDPPPPPKIFAIPSVFFQEGYVECNYDNNIEEKVSMQNLPSDSAVMLFFITTSLDSGYYPVGLFETDDIKLQEVLLSEKAGDGLFKLAIQPEQFFGGFFTQPDEKLLKLKILVRKRTITGFNPGDFINDPFILKFGCK
jgi:hypothetical protein